MSEKRILLLQRTFSFILLGLLVGCSSQQKILVKSNPPLADIFVDSTNAGVTPVTIKVKKRGPAPVIRLEKAGFTSKKIQLKKRFNAFYPIKILLISGGMFAANLLKSSLLYGKVRKGDFIGSSVGLGVGLGTGLIGGAITGDYYTYKPATVDLTLEKQEVHQSKTPLTQKDSIPLYGPVTADNPVSKIPEKPLRNTDVSTGTPTRKIKLNLNVLTTIVTKAGKEFSGILIQKNPDRLVLNIKGSCVTFYKNGIKDIRQ